MNADRTSLLELDIDSRIAFIWEAVDVAAKKGNLNDLDVIAGLIRAAYGQGYTDALREPRGKLQLDNGYPVPKTIDESAK